ncbi:MAG: hypothetical protein KC553_01510 [Nitrospina sp.]|nr:hypothetical protein [Nitrospina sp.]
MLALWLHWKKELPFTLFCVSTAAISLFATQSITLWSPVKARVFIVFLCLLPAIATLLQEKYGFLSPCPQKISGKWFFLLSGLGGVNVIFSHDPWASLKGVVILLIGGILAAYCASRVLNTEKKIFIFSCLLTFLLWFLCLAGLWELQINPNSRNPLRFFYQNPIPSGAMLVLYSLGPLLLVSSKKKPLQIDWILYGLIIFAFTYLLLMLKKGPLLSCVVAITLGVIWGRPNLGRLVPLLLLPLTFVLVYSLSLTSDDFDFFFHFHGILVRLELWKLGLSVFEVYPLQGYGFNSSLLEFVRADYQTWLYYANNGISFVDYFSRVNALDNMLLTFLAELGLMFFLAYCFFLRSILKCWFKGLGLKNFSTPEKMVSLVLIAILIQSLTFDVLKFPDLSWMWHTVLTLGPSIRNSRAGG